MAAERSQAGEVLRALVTVGVWIPLLATAPMILGALLWKRVGSETALPWRHALQAGACAVFVLAAVLLSGRRTLLDPTRPRRPLAILLFVPLMLVNVTRGPWRRPAGRSSWSWRSTRC